MPSSRARQYVEPGLADRRVSLSAQTPESLPLRIAGRMLGPKRWMRKSEVHGLDRASRRVRARPGRSRRPRVSWVLFYKALRFGMAYADPGVSVYEARYRQRVVQHLQRFVP
jgi:hypothetical protein